MNNRQDSLTGPKLLQHCEDNWQTSMGSIIFGKGAVIRGKEIFEEFGDCRSMEFNVFAVTGRKSILIARLIEALGVIGGSYPDPRLWNNRVAALAGTTRSTGALAITAGAAVSEATIYGLRPVRGAIDLLYRFKDKLDEGQALEQLIKEELKKYRAVYGFGRPITARDERIAPLMNIAKSIGAEKGAFTNLAFEIGDYLKGSRYQYQINIAGAAAGLIADQGLSPTEYYNLTTLSFTGGITPCYIDSANQKEGTLFPLSTKRINYNGTHTSRNWHEQDN